ncbi:MAG: type II toxin-antitoxin system RelE/ParE family toxin [Candidatus Eremiobacteraeota bacterium]|nr:type II toxin-antitoxin system RelE/ParE family toxin [Candidatus Eremiobacteraeota bacterium]
MPEEIQDEMAAALRTVQCGSVPSNAKLMKANLRDLMEVSANSREGTFRMIYTTSLRGVIYVLDVFQKKSRSGISTSQRDLARLLNRFHQARVHYAKTS